MTVKELKDFIFKSYYRRMGFTKENSYQSVTDQNNKDWLLFATKFKKIPKASNSKEYY